MTRRPLAFESFDQILADVDRLRRDGYTQLGKWNLARMCSHLATSMRSCAEVSPRKAPWLIRRTIGPYFLRRIVSTRKMRSGLPLPKAFAPKDDANLDQEIDRLKKAVALIVNHKGDWPEHPIFGPMTTETVHGLQLTHCAHHLSFLMPKTAA